jgi:hypothetical protein
MPRLHALLLVIALAPGFSRADELTPPADRGVALANSIVHAIDAPAQLVTGNGDLALMWNGAAGRFDLAYGKADFWGVVRGNITTAGHLHLACPEINGGTYHAEQHIGPATITGKFAKAGAELSTTAWIAYPQNLVVTELANTGTVALHFTSALVDGLGTPSLPADTGTTNDTSWIQVTPDLVDFQVGSRAAQLVKKGPKTFAAFIGRIAGIEITTPDAKEPYLPWRLADVLTRNLGNLAITPGDEHGDSVTCTGELDHRLLLRGGCNPENGFTLTAWINPTQPTPDATVFAAIGTEQPFQYPYFRGLLVHLVDGKPEVRWNYYRATATQPVPLNQWTQLKAVYAHQLLTLYVNGEKVAQADNPPASAQLGWDKCTLRTGDPALPFRGCAPQALFAQRVLGVASNVAGQQLTFTLAPGQTAKLLVAIVSDRNSPDYRAKTLALAASSEADVAKLRAERDAWWHDFWSKSFVEIPDRRVMENWYGSLYVLACSSRADCPPPGLWHNFITGMNMPWQGDYTLDYNYQAPFWAAYATNHFELADNYEPLLLDHISRGESIARNAWRMDPARQPDSLEKYLAQRAATPPTPNPAVYKGIYLYTHLIPMPGWSNDWGTFWGQKSNAVFCCVNIAQRWRLTRSPDYADEVYPFLKGTADFWDAYLTFADGRYSSLNDAVCENSGNNTNPAATLSFLRLFYPCVLEISERLNVDADRRAKWRDIIAKLSPFTYADAASITELKDVSPDLLKGKKVIRDCEANGPDFPLPAYLVYHDHKQRSSSAGMSGVQAIFPGWTIGLESTPDERAAALNTVTFAAQWFDTNNDCNFYPAAAAVGYDPHEILANLDTLIAMTEQPDFTIKTFGGGTEDDAIVPATLTNMFLQSYQANIHLFPNWPMEQDATFGRLPACGGFLIGSQVRQGKVTYVEIVSLVGETCHVANPWPGAKVRIHGASDTTAAGTVLAFPTKAGETLLLTPAL